MPNMRIIRPYVEVVTQNDLEAIRRKIEWAGRKCYKSEDKITKESAPKFIMGLIERGHESVIEHGIITVNFVIDRALAQQLTRHRIAAYSMESQRYCNYILNKFDNEITFIEPFYFKDNPVLYDRWYKSCEEAEKAYFDLLNSGANPEKARVALNNSTKTEIVTTYNMREWRHFFSLRCAVDAHPQMRQVAIPLLLYFARTIPEFFQHIAYDRRFSKDDYAEIHEVSI